MLVSISSISGISASTDLSAISATDLNVPMILVKITDPDFYTKLDFSRLFQLLKFANFQYYKFSYFFEIYNFYFGSFSI
jgi:hypothetical protein